MAQNDFWTRVLAVKGTRGWKDLIKEIRDKTGWKSLNRATVARWEEKPSPRARWAIELLEAVRKPSEGKEFVIVEPDTLLALPSTLTWIGTDKPGDGRSYLKNHYGVRASGSAVKTGGEALLSLESGEAHLAVAAEVLIRSRKYKSCSQVCAISYSPVVAIARKGIYSPSSLKRVRFGCLGTSAIPQIVREARRRRGLPIREPVRYESPTDLTNALTKKEIDGIIAWDSIIHEVRTTLGPKVRFDALPEGLFGVLRQGVAVNLEVADPASVWAYLDALTSLSTNPLSRVTSVVRTHFGLMDRDIEAEAEGMHFRIHRVNLKTLLRLRGFQIGQSREGH